MQAGDLIKEVGNWEMLSAYKNKSQLGLVLEAGISNVGEEAITCSWEKRAKILWDDGRISSVAEWTVEVISEGR